MANTSERTLRLLSLLQTHRYWSGEALAGRLRISTRTLRRDIDRLRELGYPVEAQRGVEGGYQLAAGAVLPPLLLDDEEAVALGVGLQAAVQSGSVAGIAEASVRALAKIAQVMPPRLRRRVDALAAITDPASWGSDAPSVDPEVLDDVAAQGARDRERLTFTYTARDGETSEREVEPHRLVLLGRRWYLVAWDLGRFDWRSFRLDRMREPSASGSRFALRPLPAADAAEFVRARIEALPAAYQVEALVEAPASLVRERLGRWAVVEEVDGGRCVLRMSAASLDWAAIALGLAGAEFTVRAPGELGEHLRGWAGRLSRGAPSPPASSLSTARSPGHR